uniref:Uncharacterized protein n=1 Tax=Kalanchoe fedtschenkoi TaxID=63787 RepID=A0A7N0VJF7_KALFE
MMSLIKINTLRAPKTTPTSIRAAQAAQIPPTRDPLVPSRIKRNSTLRVTHASPSPPINHHHDPLPQKLIFLFVAARPVPRTNLSAQIPGGQDSQNHSSPACVSLDFRIFLRLFWFFVLLGVMVMGFEGWKGGVCSSWGFKSLTRRKQVDSVHGRSTPDGHHQLAKALSATHLVAIGEPSRSIFA